MMKDNFLKHKLIETYNKSFDYDGVSGQRLAERLGQLSLIGHTADNGSNRPGFSHEEKEAQSLIIKWMIEAGLTVHVDGAGNVFGRLQGKDPALPAILSGSHVDSVPNGGHFDGPLGVLAALEVVESWKEIGYQPEKSFEVTIFTDEEGSRFNNGLNGSEAVIGKGNIKEKIQLKDANGLSFEEVLKEIGLTVEGYEKSVRNFNDIETFIEVHIEQGKRLEKEDLPCGIVTGIAGPCWLEFIFDGVAGHAGNTPMNDRKDALIAASEFILEVSKLPNTVSDSAVATVGKLNVEPNGVNVIPGKVTLYVDIRDIFKDTRDDLVNKVLATSKKIAEKYNIHVDYSEKARISPVPISDENQQQLEQSLKSCNIRPYRLPSGAGHDAMIIGEKTPVAMLFVRSKDGISHHPDEWSDLNDCVQAVHVLKKYVEQLQKN